MYHRRERSSVGILLIQVVVVQPVVGSSSHSSNKHDAFLQPRGRPALAEARACDMMAFARPLLATWGGCGVAAESAMVSHNASGSGRRGS